MTNPQRNLFPPGPATGGLRDRDVQRVLGRITKTDTCWLWPTAKGGYGAVWFNGRTCGAHRAVYEIFHGPIPKGMELDHLCRVHSCVNPDHLEPVTHVENVMRGKGIGVQNAAKTHCPQGHPYDDVNTYWWRTWRYCRSCLKANRQKPK